MNEITKRQKDYLNAAIGLVSERGFSKLTFRNIAQEVGVTEASVYRHFSNKLDLLRALLKDLEESIAPHFEKLVDTSIPPKERLEQLIRGLFCELEKNSAHTSIIFSEEAFHSEEELRNDLKSISERNISFLSSFYKDLQENQLCRSDIDSKELALVTLGSIKLTVTRWRICEKNLGLEDAVSNLINTHSVLFNLRNE